MVIGQKKFTETGNKLEKRVIEIVGEKSMVRSFENGLKNFKEKKDYLFFDNGLGEKSYTIYSSELKKGICEVLKDFIKVSGFGDEEFIVKVKESSEKEFGFGDNSNLLNEKDRKDKEKNQITYSTGKELVPNVPQIRDLTAEEEQKLKDEGVEFVDSSKRGKKEEKTIGGKDEEFISQQGKKNNQGDKRYGGGSNLGIFF